MSQVTRRVLALLSALSALSAIPATAQEPKPAAWEWGIHGTLLMNGFSNDSKVNNSDVPTLAMPADLPGSLPAKSLGAAIRQTRLIGTGDLAGFAGGSLHTELDVDFYGGQFANGRTSPVLRLRRAFGEVRWDRATLLIGQEGPLVADINPRGLAAIGIPGYASAGNLWLWIPQVRAGYDLAGRDGLRFGFDGVVMAPTTEEAQTIFLTAPNLAERSGRPMLEARLRATWGDDGIISLGSHWSWLATTGDSLLDGGALVAALVVPVGRVLEVRGEFFTGQGLGGLGGGGVGQTLDSDGAPMETSGGWLQLNLMAGPHWELGTGYGWDDPKGASGDQGSTTFRDANQQYGLRAQWRMAPAVIAFEYRHLATEWGGGIGERTATHLNLAAGIEF